MAELSTEPVSVDWRGDILRIGDRVLFHGVPCRVSRITYDELYQCSRLSLRRDSIFPHSLGDVWGADVELGDVWGADIERAR